LFVTLDTSTRGFAWFLSSLISSMHCGTPRYKTRVANCHIKVLTYCRLSNSEISSTCQANAFSSSGWKSIVRSKIKKFLVNRMQYIGMLAYGIDRIARLKDLGIHSKQINRLTWRFIKEVSER